jgi:D-glycero-alpha-D-manno-heptose-7-phosphate kinase
MLLVDTGLVRSETRPIEKQIENYRCGRPEVAQALHRIKQLALDARQSLLDGNLNQLAGIMHEDFVQKSKTAENVSNPQIEEMYHEARSKGAIGGKICGAGGGGFMVLYCPVDRHAAVAERLQRMGASVLPVSIDCKGVESWTAI